MVGFSSSETKFKLSNLHATHRRMAMVKAMMMVGNSVISVQKIHDGGNVANGPNKCNLFLADGSSSVFIPTRKGRDSTQNEIDTTGNIFPTQRDLGVSGEQFSSRACHIGINPVTDNCQSDEGQT